MHEHGMLLRRTVQFHWRNEGYRDFEDFLARLSHARRKNIRQERRRVREAGVRLRWLEGAAIERRRLGILQPLLPRDLRGAPLDARTSAWSSSCASAATLPENLAMVLAEREGRPIACRRCSSQTQTTLYGRYWGAIEHVPLLHFECCYYQPIEFAIAPRPRGLRRRRAGRAQAVPRPDAGGDPLRALARPPAALRAPWKRSSSARARGVARYVDELCEHSPFQGLGELRCGSRQDCDHYRRRLGIRRGHRAALRRGRRAAWS